MFKTLHLLCLALAVLTASLVSVARPIRGASASSSEEFPANDQTPYDAEVEFIEFTGAQWVNTGYHAQPITTFFCSITVGNTQSGTYFGAGKGADISGFGDAIELRGQWANPPHMRITDTYYNDTFVEFPLNERLLIECDVQRVMLSINGVVAIDTSSTAGNKLTKEGQYPIFLGCMNVAGTASRFTSNVKWHYWAAQEQSDMKIFLVPVRIGDVGFFYDRMSGLLIEINGDGSYKIGPDKE